MHNTLRDKVSARVYGNSIFASRIALHLSPQVPMEILGNRNMIYSDHYYFAFTTLSRYGYPRELTVCVAKKRSGNLYRYFIKVNTRGAALGSTIKEYYLRTTTTVDPTVIYGTFQRPRESSAMRAHVQRIYDDRKNNPRGSREIREDSRSQMMTAMLRRISWQMLFDRIQFGYWIAVFSRGILVCLLSLP